MGKAPYDSQRRPRDEEHGGEEGVSGKAKAREEPQTGEEHLERDASEDSARQPEMETRQAWPRRWW
jgi:hypothetical protein